MINTPSIHEITMAAGTTSQLLEFRQAVVEFPRESFGSIWSVEGIDLDQQTLLREGLLNIVEYFKDHFIRMKVEDTTAIMVLLPEHCLTRLTKWEERILDRLQLAVSYRQDMVKRVWKEFAGVRMEHYRLITQMNTKLLQEERYLQAMGCTPFHRLVAWSFGLE